MHRVTSHQVHVSVAQVLGAMPYTVAPLASFPSERLRPSLGLACRHPKAYPGLGQVGFLCLTRGVQHLQLQGHARKHSLRLC